MKLEARRKAEIQKVKSKLGLSPGRGMKVENEVLGMDRLEAGEEDERDPWASTSLAGFMDGKGGGSPGVVEGVTGKGKTSLVGLV